MSSAPPLSRGLVALLAFTAGASVANLYYVQPLLDAVARELGVGEGTAGLLVTASQVGYVAGLALLVPLGDLVERRRLITGLLLGAAVAAALCASAPGLGVLAFGLLALGVLAVVAQIVVPLAALLAAPGARGQAVGTVMSGLLCGILAARTVSGVVASVGGWRLVFVVAAVLMVGLAALVRRVLPPVDATTSEPYGALLASVVTLVRREPVLRQRMVLGACGMAGFSVLWTAIAFLLAAPPYGYGEAVIGLFGLAGLAGAVMAPVAGRFADRGRGGVVLTAMLALVAVSWLLLAWGGTSLGALVVGVVLFDLGLQGAQISNQSAIYALDEDARSRLTTAYMVSMFLGGVLGSAAGASVYEAAGWDAVCALGGAIAVVAGVVWAVGAWRLGPAAVPDAASSAS